MEITSDVLLKGMAWSEVIERLKNIIPSPLQYNIYVLCISIGILYDSQIETTAIDDGDEVKTVPRTVLLNNNHAGQLDFFAQSAILTSKNLSFNEEERLELAFSNKSKIEFNKLKFLTSFANYGVKRLIEKLDENELNSIESLKNYLDDLYKGINIDFEEIENDLLED